MAQVIFGTLAEWLRRGPAKAVGYACVSSNLTGVVTHFFFGALEMTEDKVVKLLTMTHFVKKHE